MATSVPEENRFCDICQCQVPGGGWASHIAGRAHCRRASSRTEAVLESSNRNRNGVSVSTQETGLDFGIVNPGKASEVVKYFVLKVTTENGEFMVLGPQWTSMSLSVGANTPFSCGIEGDPYLRRGRDVRVVIRLRVTEIGRYEDMLEIRFARVSNNQPFSVTRKVKAIIGDPADYALLLPTAPYTQRRRANREAISDWIPGVPPTRSSAIAWRSKLRLYKIPAKDLPILSLPPVNTNAEGDIVPPEIRSYLPGTLNLSTHADTFCKLLWLEEIAMENALRIYDMESVVLSKHGKFYQLSVPGLAEKRPSVITGDTVLVQMIGAAHDAWYEGHVHYVLEAQVALRFHSSFPKDVIQQRFNVRFQLNRMPLRRIHQALHVVHHPNHLLFPRATHVQSTRISSGSTLSLYDRKISNNPRQVSAIERILALAPTSAPFIIFGPPGTGKTVTIVEAIKQILRRDPSTHILACAPSNSAADIIALRLSELLQPHSLFRFYAPSRESKNVPKDLLRYTVKNGEGVFSHPPLDSVKAFRVVVTTCLSAAFAEGIGVERSHFSHIFIDEAAQATEPEAMVVVKNTAHATTKLILSGDPKQLRPIVSSVIANELGLSVSYLERLVESGVYRGSNSGGSGIVKLLNNYRSHPAIIRFPNERFYDGELQTCGDPSSINSCLNLRPLVQRKYPVIFCSVEGRDAREASSPSFFNPEEVLRVKAYVQQLLADTHATPRIEPAHIGIIAPYRAQCSKLRIALKKIAPEIKIGSVEEYQGDERRVIIITTVRSSRDYINYDLRFTLGFVANPRRFNVAVTRAKALLIIVGDPSVLGLDPLWRAYLNDVHAGGGWRGHPIPWDPLAPVNPDGGYDVDMRLRALGDADVLAQRLWVDEPDEDQPFREPEE